MKSWEIREIQNLVGMTEFIKKKKGGTTESVLSFWSKVKDECALFYNFTRYIMLVLYVSTVLKIWSGSYLPHRNVPANA